ncbi:hypothetical protein HMPREF1977_0337 [Capnocytophaga ochracea F0287]|uniref:Uncharacterized protein n=1 Tax=Capnocytophaga ochracea F0287 TaxID=873517 RepID=E4MPM7_CAPOC|nr:hypothetical protein [Capnocytophaga ochracea]EFS98357.1 hypothetical protein HMPREF1977_0337 [Capnocytophaga ochracea F0287]EJF45706.1 hypothetical protein HMPREF1319_1341 [Capnocytophaga ochracea str. Holt 25]UEB43376.1 hypothetical protein LK419_11380 [Capnocytophaga ochracea]
MNLKSFYYDSFYQEFSFNNESINIVLLELLKYNITYPIHSLFEELKIYENKHLSSEWYQFIEHFDIDEDFLMLENRKGEFFGMGRNNQRFDLLNFDFSNLTNFPNTIIEFVNIQLKISFLNLSRYNFLQSTENPQYYDTYNLKYDKSKLYFNEFIQLELLDISKNVGRKRDLGNFIFYPAYKIWFGEEAQELFGKEKILQFKKAIYIKELPCGVIEMQLMDDINKCHLPYNQEKQKAIVEYLEIDKLEIPKYE